MLLSHIGNSFLERITEQFYCLETRRDAARQKRASAGADKLVFFCHSFHDKKDKFCPTADKVVVLAVWARNEIQPGNLLSTLEQRIQIEVPKIAETSPHYIVTVNLHTFTLFLATPVTQGERTILHGLFGARSLAEDRDQNTTEVTATSLSLSQLRHHPKFASHVTNFVNKLGDHM